MSPKALPARQLLFQPSHPPPIVVQVEGLLCRFVYNIIENGFIIIVWVIFFYTIFLPDGQNITFVWDSMFEDICAAEFVFL